MSEFVGWHKLETEDEEGRILVVYSNAKKEDGVIGTGCVCGCRSGDSEDNRMVRTTYLNPAAEMRCTGQQHLFYVHHAVAQLEANNFMNSSSRIVKYLEMYLTLSLNPYPTACWWKSIGGGRLGGGGMWGCLQQCR